MCLEEKTWSSLMQSTLQCLARMQVVPFLNNALSLPLFTTEL